MFSERLRSALETVREHPIVSGVIGVLGTLVVVLSVLLAVAQSDSTIVPGESTSSATSGVSAPEDGDLTVGSDDEALVVPQLSGECEDTSGSSSCTFDAGDVPTLTSPPASLSLRATESTTFSASVVNTDNPTAIPKVEAIAQELVFVDASAGTYSVTLLGDQGGVWQLFLVIE